MNPTLLALETSSHIGAVSLVCGSRILARTAVANEIKLSAWLLPAIQQLMQTTALQPEQIDGVAYGAGPGAFTGVRTACATAQALAYAWGKPLLAVDSLHALAAVTMPHCPATSQLEIVLDARMAEVYSAGFQVSSRHPLPLRSSPTLVQRAQTWVAPIPAEGTMLCLIGSGSSLVSVPADTHVWRPTEAQHAQWELQWADGVAYLAAAMLQQGETVAPVAAEPFYVRNNVAQTEAERALARNQTRVTVRI